MIPNYHLRINLLDRSSPNLSRNILGGGSYNNNNNNNSNSNNRSSNKFIKIGRTPHPTSTGLPGQLDFLIANTPSYFPQTTTKSSNSKPQTRSKDQEKKSKEGPFWSDLSKAPTTRLGERWDKLEEFPPISPTTLWYEPDQVSKDHDSKDPHKKESSSSSSSSSAAAAAKEKRNFDPTPTLDYRFGPISIDWVDNPAYHPAFLTNSSSEKEEINKLEPIEKFQEEKMSNTSSKKKTSNTPSSKKTSKQQQHQQHDPRPSTSNKVDQNLKEGLESKNDKRSIKTTQTTPSNLRLPTGKFLPSPKSRSQGDSYQLGSTDFGYGSIHLFKDFDEASTDDQKFESLKSGNGDDDDDDEDENELDGFEQVKDPDGLVIGVLAIPSYMTSQDFLAFISPVVESVESVRMLRDALPNRCIGLIKFRNKRSARNFSIEFNGKPFSHLQDREICHTAQIKSIRFKSTLIPPFTFPALLPPDLLTKFSNELPTCPVCLERMDSSVTGLMTNTCSHTFHCHCLSNWGDSRCPICRYSQSKLFRSSNPDRSECSACGSGANLWICLICGNVGCGRYQGGHAYKHFEDCSHLYALELGSQRVWDYVGDNYVHRLIQTKSDQIVELPALSSAVFDGGGGPNRNESAHQSKIEAISEEFGNLVASQLDSQRSFYEEEIELLKVKMNSKLLELDQERIKSEEFKIRLKSLEDERDLLKDEKMRGSLKDSKKIEKVLELNRKIEDELKEERMMTEGMRLQIKVLEDQKVLEIDRRSKLESEVKELKDQVRDLMFFLEAQSKVQSEGGEELKNGSITIQTNNNNSNSNNNPQTTSTNNNSNSSKSNKKKKK